MGKSNPVSVRIPQDVKDWLKATADAEHRTMSSQLLHILEQAKEAHQGKTA